MEKLSVVIITLNEERNIRRCLESVKDISSEIVIVDSLSTDNTVSIAKEFGAITFLQPFLGYIQQKQLAISKASNNFILVLDADEALNNELIESIRNALQHPNADVYTMNRLTNYCGKWIRHGGWYPDRKLRMFRKEMAINGGVNPHDILLPVAGATSSWLKGDILHYSYSSIEDHIKQSDNFSTIASKALFEKGKKATFVKRFLSPVVKFIVDYFLKLGFMDGYYGFIICKISAKATYLKYAKLNRLNKPSIQ